MGIGYGRKKAIRTAMFFFIVFIIGFLEDCKPYLFKLENMFPAQKLSVENVFLFYLESTKGLNFKYLSDK